MVEIPISKFKATCLAVLEDVRRTRRRVRVTRFGKPVAEIGPPTADLRATSWVGSMRGTGKVIADIVGPASQPEDWDALSQ